METLPDDCVDLKIQGWNKIKGYKLLWIQSLGQSCWLKKTQRTFKTQLQICMPWLPNLLNDNNVTYSTYFICFIPSMLKGLQDFRMVGRYRSIKIFFLITILLIKIFHMLGNSAWIEVTFQSHRAVFDYIWKIIWRSLFQLRWRDGKFIQNAGLIFLLKKKKKQKNKTVRLCKIVKTQ